MIDARTFLKPVAPSGQADPEGRALPDDLDVIQDVVVGRQANLESVGPGHVGLERSLDLDDREVLDVHGLRRSSPRTLDHARRTARLVDPNKVTSASPTPQIDGDDLIAPLLGPGRTGWPALVLPGLVRLLHLNVTRSDRPGR